MFCRIFSVLLLMVFVGGPVRAADTWHIGVNNLFVQDYLSNTVSCATGLSCPQTRPIPLSSIDYLLNDLAANQHVGLFREIVNFSWIFPTSATDSTNWSLIDAVLDEYEKYNIKLIFALGNPLPAWAQVTGSDSHGQCWLPALTDSTSFNTVKNNIAVAFGNYLNHYISRGSAQATWAKNLLTVEAWNELDSIQTASDCGGTSRVDGTPARNAALTNGIAYVLGPSDLNLSIFGQAMASVGGVYNGYACPPTCTETDIFKKYLQDYYAAPNYGGAWPNVHAYIGADGTQSGILAAMEPIIAGVYLVATYAPAGMSTHVIFGETGWEQVKSAPPCSAGGLAIIDSVRNGLYTAVVSDATISADTWSITFWDSVQYPTPTYDSLGCNANWGIINADATYSQAAINLWTYLKTH